MAKLYKGIEYTSTPSDEVEYHKNQTFTETSTGVNSVQFRSESLEFNDSGVGQLSYTKSGSHFNFSQHIIFDTGSIFDIHPYGSKFFKNKFYKSGSAIYIPQQYFGERIIPKSFKLTDYHNSNYTIRIEDDGNGNLYSPNAHFSQSATTALSSSDNYVGNIHYETGVVLITETGSWSGSKGGNDKVGDIIYPDVGTNKFNLDFKSSKIIHSNEIIFKIKAGEFNATTNKSVFSASNQGFSSKILDTISGSTDFFSPYASTVAFFNKIPGQQFEIVNSNGDDGAIASHYEEKALLIGNFPAPIQMSKDTDLTIIIRYDT